MHNPNFYFETPKEYLMEHLSKVLNKKNFSFTENSNADNCLKQCKEPVIRNLTRKLSSYFIKNSFSFPLKILFRLSKYLLPVSHSQVIAQTNHNFDMLLNFKKNSTFEKSIYYFGTYEPATLNIVKKCMTSGDTFIDIGANTGLLSLYASSLTGNSGMVYSFEPEPSSFDVLQKNIFINNAENVKPLNFQFDSIKTLDNFICQNDISDVKFIKIDANKQTLEILNGAKNLLHKENAPVLCIAAKSLSKNETLKIYNFLKEVNAYRFFKFGNNNCQISDFQEIHSSKDISNNKNIFCLTQEQVKLLL